MTTLSRRGFLQTSIALWPAISSIQQVAAQSQKPNVLFIAIDDLNDWIGCLGGHPDTKTPNIDRLANQGVLFTRAYCSAPACNPSRASLLSGILPSTSGVYQNSQPWREKMPDVVTLPHHFKNNGYLVKGRGKIFHGSHSQDEQGWHEYIPKGNDPQPDNRPLNGIPNTKHFDWGPLDVSDEEMDDTKVANWASDFLAQEHDKPFFLAVGLFRPHLPWYAPKHYHDKFPPEEVTLPDVKEDDLDDVSKPGQRMARLNDHKNVTETDNWHKAVSGYLASINFTDTNVGRVIKALENSLYKDNTIIVLWGDHGWHLGEKLHWRKFALWEEATHCPLIISTPEMRKGTHSENRSGQTVTLLDIYPTLCDLCNLPKPKQLLEGHSLKQLLNDPKKQWKHHALTTHGYKNHSVRSERYRYIQYENGSEELYDHQNDPMEWNNLAGKEEYQTIIDDQKKSLPKVNVKG